MGKIERRSTGKAYIRGTRDLVLIPAHNEAMNLSRVLDRVADVLPNADVLVIDDGSSDDTYNIAVRYGVNVIKHPFNLGLGATLQTGYHFALKNGYERLVQFDGDGQHEPEDVAGMFRMMDEKGSDIVIGCRFMEESGPYPMPWMRRMGRAYQVAFVKLLARRRFFDPTSGLCAMNRHVMELFCQDAFPVDFPDADVLVMLCKAGVQIDEFPAHMRTREFGSSLHDGGRWVYYMFRITLSLIVIAMGRGFKPVNEKADVPGSFFRTNCDLPAEAVRAV
jgi:glycosyltransferase involved in cell wall biosynthesis